ncbi:protein of unknown function DUF928 [Gloeothece citriformis PCC 7424]|uniref:DUF928 domain-containing protein n=1 Tax=Gloeothece citriformis (strain PCC 7424) TaxID=65393 RepID=B7KBA4_GLOC7|nr:DUF928 domain-containing protein [Gloeothece citriformis]ACK71460.1 protein of unknown function DUF928 [Gloeothece citriformis PCC 7424]
MMKFLKFVQLLTLVALIEVTLTAIQTKASQTQLPNPPDTGTPTGDPTPATTRPQGTCPKTTKPLTALMANNRNDYTRSDYPSLWFYIPYDNTEITQLEFVLLDEMERRTIYRTGIKLNDRSGIIQITIPSNSKYALQPNKTYRWYLMLDCKNSPNEEPALVVNGWIGRLPDESQSVNSAWYDTINERAKQHFKTPDDEKSNQAWVSLLQNLGYNWLVQEPFANSTKFPLPN